MPSESLLAVMHRVVLHSLLWRAHWRPRCGMAPGSCWTRCTILHQQSPPNPLTFSLLLYSRTIAVRRTNLQHAYWYLSSGMREVISWRLSTCPIFWATSRFCAAFAPHLYHC